MYNAVQKALYIGVLFASVVIVTSSLAIRKPVQLRGLTALLGGYDAARIVHFFSMTAIVIFLAIHVVMALRSGELIGTAMGELERHVSASLGCTGWIGESSQQSDIFWCEAKAQ